MIRMRYIETSTLNCQIYPGQRRELERLKAQIEQDYDIKIPISELVRRALDVGLPAVAADTSFVIELIG